MATFAAVRDVTKASLQQVVILAQVFALTTITQDYGVSVTLV